MRSITYRSRAWRLVLSCLLLALISACASVPRTAEQSIARGELDPREYRYLELPNRMRVLLISDPATDKAAASLHVRAGSGDDPLHRQGLAHFLEHMLFLGTAKYPDPGEYQAFINAHGGSHNAYTSIDHTNYFFDIDPDSLEPALDRFSQFFTAPLFNREYVDREMNAVDSEYNLGLKDDNRREYDVFREIVNPEHPLATLAVGNLQTLSGGTTDIREDLLKFYDAHYSSNLMTLVVLGPQRLDELADIVESRFAAVSDRDLEARVSAPPIFLPGSLPREVRIRPEKDLRELSLLFPVPSARGDYRGKPLEYIGNLLGHEGPGSLLSVLKARGWAEGVGAGAGLDIYGEDAFQVSIQLTEEGVQHADEIVGLVFAAVDQLRQRGIEKWRFEEQGRLGELAFRFREKGSPTGAVIGAANALQEYPVADVLRGPYVFADFDAGLLQRYLDYLRPENVLVTLTHKSVATDRQSQWYAAPYSVRALDPTALAAGADTALVAQLALPEPNDFIPRDVSIKALASDETVPRALALESDYRLWHLQDPEFPAPKASIYFRVLSPAATATARDAALAELHARLVADELNEFAYPATLAGLQYGVAPTNRGIGVQIAGYDDRQIVLLEKILRSLRHTRFPADRFDSLKTELMRGWSNARKERPFVQLIGAMDSALVARHWSDAEMLEAIRDQGPAELETYLEHFYDGAALEVLVHGNFVPQEAQRIGGIIRTALHGSGPKGVEVPSFDIAALQAGVLPALGYEVDHPDSAAVVYIQGSAADYGERALMGLSAQIISADFFNELRTEKQLGYVVFAQSRPLYRVPGLMLTVQSPNTGAMPLAGAIDDFLQHYREQISSLSDADFERHRAALVERLMESPKTLGEKSGRLWSDLMIGATDFDDRARVAAEVERISRTQWTDYFSAQIAGPARRAILFYSLGTSHRDAPVAAVPGLRPFELAAFRRNLRYYRFDWTGKDAISGETPHAVATVLTE